MRDNLDHRHSTHVRAGLTALSAVSLGSCAFLSCGGTPASNFFENPMVTASAIDDAGGGGPDSGSPFDAREDHDAGLTSTFEEAGALPASDGSTQADVPIADAGGSDAFEDGDTSDAPLDLGRADAPNAQDVEASTDVCQSAPLGNNAITGSGFESVDRRGAGWTGFGGCTFATTSAFAHCGSRSGECTARATAFQGPGYDLPLTATTYSVSAWVLQDGPTSETLLWNGKLICVGDGGEAITQYPAISAPMLVPPKTWVLMTGTFVVPDGCSTATLYLNQWDNPPPANLPNLYVDDVYAVH